MKRIGNKIGLDDPVHFLPNCPVEEKQWMQAEASRLQEGFKRRWLALVGPVTIVGPNPTTHSSDVEAKAWARLIKEGSDVPK
jgi:hypothetical protein